MRYPLISLLFICVIHSAQAQNRIGTGEVAELYTTYCVACHNEDLSGGLGGNLIDDEWKYGSSDAEIFQVIKNGLPELGMLPYGTVLSDNQIRSLVIYIREQKEIAEKEALLRKLEPAEGVFHSDLHAFRLESVFTGTGILWGIDFLPDQSMLVTQRDGVLWHVTPQGKATEIRDVPAVWQHGQGGLMEVGLHPNYEDNGWVYLGYSVAGDIKENNRTAGMTKVARGRIKNGAWVDHEDIFVVPDEHHTSAGVHFGTRFVFHDGYLYFAIGDRGRMERAQDLDRPNGKIFRIHDDGRIPSDNPFSDNPDAFPGIWSYGHRNPQGLDMHPVEGTLWDLEHGPRGGDELNLVEPGKNYGWPVITYGMNYNGTPITHLTHNEGMEQPALYWTPSIAICGMGFYMGDQFPKWKNDLFLTGLASEELHRVRIVDGEVIEDEIVMKNQGRLRDVANGPDGLLYVLAVNWRGGTGTLYRMIPADNGI